MNHFPVMTYGKSNDSFAQVLTIIGLYLAYNSDRYEDKHCLVWWQLPGVSSTQSHISEQDSFTNVYIPGSSNTPFSAIDTSMPIRVGLPPRMVERVLLEQMSAVDFVGYVPNPHWRRGIPFGDASCAVAGLRNTRQIWKVEQRSFSSNCIGMGTELNEILSSFRYHSVASLETYIQVWFSFWATQATSKEQTAANQWSTLSGVTSQLRVSGSKRLPKAYRRVEIKQSQSKLKFEEFDFSYYNKTRFAGLENDIINSYCNALLQVGTSLFLSVNGCMLFFVLCAVWMFPAWMWFPAGTGLVCISEMS